MKKGIKGTHYKSESNRKSKTFTIRLSEDDLQMIRRKSEILGLSVSEFIVSSCSGKRVVGYKKSDPEINTDIPGQMEISDYFDFFN